MSYAGNVYLLSSVSNLVKIIQLGQILKGWTHAQRALCHWRSPHCHTF